MPAKRIYREEVEVATADEGVREAARRMRDRRVGALIVVDKRRRPIGILTDRDLALRVLAEGRDPAATRVVDAMTERPVVISEETSTEAALALLSTRVPRFRRLPVVDHAGRLAGVFTIDDALARIAAELASIDRVIQGEAPFIMDGLAQGEITKAVPTAVRRIKGSST